MFARRRFLCAMPLLACMPRAVAAPVYPDVVPGRALSYPRDAGSHPDFRTEWWYITGWIEDERRAPMGVQITFFRHRPGIGESSGSAFAPRQLLFAHAALADPAYGRLRHDQRAARAGFGLAEAAEAYTDVHIDDWSLRRSGDTYIARVRGAAFAFDLSFRATQAPMQNGEGGYSRKGPDARDASYYVSEPQLAVTGGVAIGSRRFETRGVAWCDHEWSSAYLPRDASGWDWTGINLNDGGALMAFTMHRASKTGGGVLWAGGTLRSSSGTARALDPGAVRFEPRRTWRSPRTDSSYPVAIVLTAGDVRCELEPLMDDQELDARMSTGTVYWEGAVRALQEGREIGRGYLELTGYGGKFSIP